MHRLRDHFSASACPGPVISALALNLRLCTVYQDSSPWTIVVALGLWRPGCALGTAVPTRRHTAPRPVITAA